MAAEYRKFYFDWNDGKYKLNLENDLFAKKMEHKPVRPDIKSMQETKRVLHKNGNDNVFIKDQNAERLTEAIDEVDAAGFIKLKKPFNNIVSNQLKSGEADWNCREMMNDAGRLDKNQSKSKTTQSLEELSKGHKVMTSVLNTRLIRLNAAQTLWHKDMNSFIEYLLRLDDDAVLVDLLPILTKRVKDDGPECSTLSMGACLDLLPMLRKLVDSKFEDYIVTSMDMIREVMKRWWKELQAAGKKEKEDLINANFRCSRSVNGVYMLIISMADRIETLSKRSGKVGGKAKVLHGLMELI